MDEKEGDFCIIEFAKEDGEYHYIADCGGEQYDSRKMSDLGWVFCPWCGKRIVLRRWRK